MLPGRAKGKRGQGCFHQGNQRAPKVQLKDSHEVPAERSAPRAPHPQLRCHGETEAQGPQTQGSG